MINTFNFMKKQLTGEFSLCTKDPSDDMEDCKATTLLQLIWTFYGKKTHHIFTPFAALVTTEECAKFYDITLAETITPEDVNVNHHQMHIIETLLLNIDEFKNPDA